MKQAKTSDANAKRASKRAPRAHSISINGVAPHESPKQVKSFIDLWLGEQIRSRRKSHKKSLQEIAEACNISVSLLSQMERGLRSASVATLELLAKELDTPIETLLHNVQIDPSREDDAQGAITRSGRHRRIDGHEAGIHKEILTPSAVATGELQMYRAVIEPGGSTGNTFFTTTNGQQVGYVVEGTLELHVGEKLFRLQGGDSFSYDSSMPRRWRNPSDKPTVVLWAVRVHLSRD